LVDEGSSVGVRAFTNVAEAVESHRAGGARLLWLAHPDQVNHLKKKFPLGLMAKVEMPRLGVGGTSLERLILLAGEGAAGGVFPRSPEDFKALTENTRGRWYEAATKIGKAIDEIHEILPEVRSWVAANRKDRNLGEIAEDIEEQLTWLFRADFVWRAGFADLKEYPRRLRAIRSRLGRVASLPIVKDLEKLDRFRKLWEPWFQKFTADPEDPALWPAGWALEEYRISLFAPDIPVVGKVSAKKIEEMTNYFTS
jgi:ATP-dependent helicase HrpA